MNKPVLVVMAAGMGSRYGGMKQIDPVGPCGQVIVDYSLYDARRAGFETVIFVIKHEIEEAFKAAIGDRVSRVMDVKYAFQQLDELPEGYTIPEGRVKPWGTCHAVLAAKPYIHGPFAVINADDYYGPEAFKVIYDHLSTHTDGEVYDYCMVSYLLKNTVSENGSVARGVCALNEDSTLHGVTERTRIETYEDGIHYTEDGGESWTDLPGETPVSMNLWGFGESFVKEADRRFARWLDENLEKNPLKCEYFLPLVVSELIGEKKAAVTVLRSTDKWYGVTYREDKPVVVEAIAKKTADGLYPENLCLSCIKNTAGTASQPYFLSLLDAESVEGVGIFFLELLEQAAEGAVVLTVPQLGVGAEHTALAQQMGAAAGAGLHDLRTGCQLFRAVPAAGMAVCLLGFCPARPA